MPEIRYTFTASGQEAVSSAFRSIRQAADQTASAVSASAAKSEASRVSSMKRGQSAALAIARNSGSQFIAVEQRVASTRASLAKSASLKQRVALAAELRAFEAMEKRKSAIARAEGNKRIQEERRAARGGGAGRRGGGFLGRVGRSVASFGVVSAGIALTGGVGAAVRQTIDDDTLARQIAVKGRETGGSRLDPKRIVEKARKIALANPGVTAKSVLQAQNSVLERTGNFKLSEEIAGFSARAALATGSNVEDVAGAASSLVNQFGGDGEQAKQFIAALTLQGKRGAFEIKDFAKGAPKILAAAKTLGVGGDDLSNVLTIGGLAQVSQRGAGSGPIASTALEGAFRTIVKKGGEGGQIHKLTGQNIDTESIAKEDLAKLFPTIIRAAGGDKQKLSKIFDRRAFTAVSGLVSMFNNEADRFAKDSGKRRDSADVLNQAQQSIIDKIRAESDARGAMASLMEDEAETQQSTGAKLTAAWENVKNSFVKGGGLKAVEDLAKSLPQLLPIIPALVSGFTAVVSGIAGLIGLLGSIPGIGKYFRQSNSQKASMLDAQISGNQIRTEQITGAIKDGTATPGQRAELSTLQQERMELVKKRAEVTIEMQRQEKLTEKDRFKEGAKQQHLDDSTMATQAAFGALGGFVGGKPGAILGTAFGTAVGPGFAAKSSEDAKDAMDRFQQFEDIKSLAQDPDARKEARADVVRMPDPEGGGLRAGPVTSGTMDVGKSAEIGAAGDMVKAALESVASAINAANVSINPVKPNG